MTTINLLLVFKEIIATYSENLTKLINTTRKLLIVKAGGIYTYRYFKGLSITVLCIRMFIYCDKCVNNSQIFTEFGMSFIPLEQTSPFHFYFAPTWLSWELVWREQRIFFCMLAFEAL